MNSVTSPEKNLIHCDMCLFLERLRSGKQSWPGDVLGTDKGKLEVLNSEEL